MVAFYFLLFWQFLHDVTPGHLHVMHKHVFKISEHNLASIRFKIHKLSKTVVLVEGKLESRIGTPREISLKRKEIFQ